MVDVIFCKMAFSCCDTDMCEDVVTYHLRHFFSDKKQIVNHLFGFSFRFPEPLFSEQTEVLQQDILKPRRNRGIWT